MHQPKLRTYRITIQPATFNGAVTRIMFSHPDDQTHKVQAASLADMQDQVRVLAVAFNRPCRAMISIDDHGRKPPGFNRACAAVREFGRARPGSTTAGRGAVTP